MVVFKGNDNLLKRHFYLLSLFSKQMFYFSKKYILMYKKLITSLLLLSDHRSFWHK